MLKTILKPEETEATRRAPNQWLGADNIAALAVTSEAEDAPAESIFDSNSQTGWRAAKPGSQLIRITFDKPVALRRIQLEFVEIAAERTQEITLQWARSTDADRTEIVRQRWNFSPGGSQRESEDYQVQLSDVLILELKIDPDITHGRALASLHQLRIS